ncbi:unnamed protein product [Coffea canephora]|uniref:Uncharacterized protein n=1 Tax=Coffea canephora TaxID=49390 RepID=A0A068U8G5_COFCA|nr:unnamed protein product [Coffea canephora]
MLNLDTNQPLCITCRVLSLLLSQFEAKFLKEIKKRIRKVVHDCGTLPFVGSLLLAFVCCTVA